MAIDLSPVNDFFSNIKDKLTNPFFGTLILVWLTRNWELVYSIFNFDNNLKLKDKVDYIEKYFATKSFWLELCSNVGLAISFMTIGYILIVLTRVLSMWIEFNLMPNLTKRTVSKNVVLKEQYDQVTEERDDYFKRYEGERNNVRKLSDNYDNISDNYKSTSIKYSDLTTLHEATVEQLETSKKALEYIKTNFDSKTKEAEKLNEYLESSKKESRTYAEDLKMYKWIFSNNNSDIRYFLLSNPEILKICQNLIKDKSIDLFCNVASFYIHGGSIEGEAVTKIQAYNVLHDRSSSLEGLNPMGELIYNYIFKYYTGLNTKQRVEFQSNIINFNFDDED